MKLLDLSTRTAGLAGVFSFFILIGGFRGSEVLKPAKEKELPVQDTTGALRGYVDFLNEFTERRRVNVYFSNQQSLSYGAQVGSVNVGRGNLTLVRRDLVAVGRIPLVLARAYDSSLKEGADFGPGWFLTVAETIEPSPDGTFVLTDETGSRTQLELQRGVSFKRLGPGDVESFRRTSDGELLLGLRGGFYKTFSPFQDRFLLTQVKDAHGNFINLDYDGGRLARMAGGNDRWIAIDRDDLGRIASIGNDQSRGVTYQYNEAGRLSKVQDLGGHRWAYRYDASGRLVEAADPDAHVHLAAGYDARGRVERIRSPLGSHSFHYRDGKTVVTDANGNTSEYEQNPSGVTVSVTNARGVHTRVVLNERDQVRKLFKGEVLEAEFQYDERGRLESLARTGGEGFFYRYHRAGRLASITEAGPSRGLGTKSLVKLRYDRWGNLVEKSDAEGVHHFSYSPQGDLMEWIPARGRPARFEHDADGQIVQVSHDSGEGTTFEYFPGGRLRQSQFADGSTQRYQYDELGLRRRTEFSTGWTVDYQHNAAGTLLSTLIRSEDGRISGNRVEVDGDQKVTSVEYLGRRRIEYGYDGMGNLTRAGSEGKAYSFA